MLPGAFLHSRANKPVNPIRPGTRLGLVGLHAPAFVVRQCIPFGLSGNGEAEPECRPNFRRMF